MCSHGSSGLYATICRRRPRARRQATLAEVSGLLAPVTTEALTVPANCTDGFFGAYWRRPDAYLDAIVRGAISGLALLDSDLVAAAVERLRADLTSARWIARYADLIEKDEIDLGYRLVVAEQWERTRRSSSRSLPV